MQKPKLQIPRAAALVMTPWLEVGFSAACPQLFKTHLRIRVTVTHIV
jgi:hypothetical protein